MRKNRRMILGCGLLAVLSLNAQAAEWPPLSQYIADCEGKWILYGDGKPENSQTLGYVYVDRQAGVTIDLQGDVRFNADGEWVRAPVPLTGKARLILRVDRNIPVACLTDAQRERIGLPVSAEFSEYYKDDRPAGVHHTDWASFFNQIGAYERGLEHVQLARDASYDSPKLELEHGFALNALEQFDAAAAVLAAALKKYPNDVEIIAELAYANLSQERYREAIDLYRRALAKDSKNASNRRWQFAHNIANAYGKLGDEKNEAKWRAQAEKWGKKQE